MTLRELLPGQDLRVLYGRADEELHYAEAMLMPEGCNAIKAHFRDGETCVRFFLAETVWVCLEHEL